MPSKRRIRWAVIPIGIAAAALLAGCTPTELNGFLPGFTESGVAATNRTEMVLAQLQAIHTAGGSMH